MFCSSSHPAPNLVNANPKDVERYRFEREISVVKGANCPNPITNFEDAGLPDYVSTHMGAVQILITIYILISGLPIL